MSEQSPKKKAKLFGNLEAEMLEEINDDCPPKPEEIPEDVTAMDERVDFMMDLTIKLAPELRYKHNWFWRNFKKIRPVRTIGTRSGRVRYMVNGKRYQRMAPAEFPVLGHWTVINRRTKKTEGWIRMAVPVVGSNEREQEWVPLKWILTTKFAPDVVFYILRYNLLFHDRCWHKITGALDKLVIDDARDREENRAELRKMMEEGKLKGKYFDVEESSSSSESSDGLWSEDDKEE